MPDPNSGINKTSFYFKRIQISDRKHFKKEFVNVSNTSLRMGATNSRLKHNKTNGTVQNRTVYKQKQNKKKQNSLQKERDDNNDQERKKNYRLVICKYY